MVKLTPELINQAMQYVNPVRDRELLLRGYKIPVIENLGATLDQYDTIDFSDNDIRKFDGFPQLNRIKALHFNNNRICRIGDDVHLGIPNLQELYLTNNELSDLSDLIKLAGFKRLEFLSLLRNPVTTLSNYRLFAIFHLPHVRVLDFRRIRLQERQAAKKLFGSKQGKKMMNDVAKKSKTFVPGTAEKETNFESLVGRPKKDRDAIREAILNAKTLDEVEKLKAMLQSGQIPGQSTTQANGEKNGKAEEVNGMEVEEDEPDEIVEHGEIEGATTTA